MLLYGIVGIVANIAALVVVAIVLSRTTPHLPKNKLCRFAFLLMVCVPVNLAINFINVQTRGYHKMSWTAAFIIALVIASFQTLLSSQSDNPNTL